MLDAEVAHWRVAQGLVPVDAWKPVGQVVVFVVKVTACCRRLEAKQQVALNLRYVAKNTGAGAFIIVEE